MKSIFIVICCCFFTLVFGQQKKYSYYLYLTNYRDAPLFENKESGALYVGKDEKLRAFFYKYDVLKFSQAFPDFEKSESILSVYLVETTSSTMINDLLRQFPSMASKFDNISERIIEPLYYPNDYGTTSPVPNLGANYDRKDLDYLHAPQAWDITKGKSEVILGISDTQIDTTSLDLNLGKVKFVSGYNGFTTLESHGTGVSEIAAGRGNNAHGSVGVCMDCNILASALSWGATSPIAYNNLYKLANEGARVINMSWRSSNYINNLADNYSQVEQDIINYLVDYFGVVLVASAGNEGSYSSSSAFTSQVSGGQPNGVPVTPFGTLYVYPASYDNVISVSSINHKNAKLDATSYCCTSPWFPVYVNIEDSVGNCVDGTDINNPVGVKHNGYYIDQYNPIGYQWGHTLNERVDILATGYDVFWYPFYLKNSEKLYAGGTSISAPIVTGTIGLMLSVYQCLNPNEIESILKLTTKDIEHLPINQNYFGHVGAGKLEIYGAVKFVKEMVNNGNATIQNHKFYRYNFLLDKIGNKLTINNVVFKEASKADFTAKNVIEILPGSDFNPNLQGLVDLKIDATIDVSCSKTTKRESAKSIDRKDEIVYSTSTLYPNPNEGTFEIALAKEVNGDINVEIYDVSGKIVYKGKNQGTTFNVNVTNLSSGLYIVRLSSGEYNETLKFIKQ